ncbi:MAG: hypothetical protein AAGA02_12810 [Bacteroidota bacterium]
MEDRLKNRVGQERADFDIYNVDADALWEGIAGELDKQKRLSPWKVYTRIAAAVVMAVGISWIVYEYNSNPYSDGFALHDLSPELAETEFFYSQQVAEKMQLIKSTNSAIDPEVLDNLAILDSAYQELKLDLKDNAANEEVIDAMITNYRIKLQLLEQILMEIKEHDNELDNEISI